MRQFKDPLNLKRKKKLLDKEKNIGTMKNQFSFLNLNYK